MENKKYIDKVIGSLLRGTKVDNEKKLISFPWLSFPLGIETELKSYFDSKDPYNSRPNFHNYCKSQFGLSSDEMKFVHDKLNFIFKDKLKNLYDLPISRFNRLNESIENNKYLDMVLDFYVRNTKIDFDNRTIFTPFIDKIKFESYMFGDLMFGYYSEKHFGLTEDEIEYLWKVYRNIIKGKIEDEE